MREGPMRNEIAVPLLTALLLLGGCDRAADGGARPPRHGRYAGIGVFNAGDLWSRMAVPKQKGSPRAATIADDEHVIVIVDTDTGEVRECGDYSGYCTAMNPWTRAIASEQEAPVSLTAHATDLAQEAAANANQAAPARH